MIYVTITIAANDYQSFESVANADVYLAVDPTATAWRALPGPDEKGGFLIAATRVLERQAWNDGVIADPLPQAVKDATALLAAAMAGGADVANNATTAGNVKRQKAGSVELEFFWSEANGTGNRFPLPVWELIRGLLASSGAAGIGGSLSAGTCGADISQIDYGFGSGYDAHRADY